MVMEIEAQIQPADVITREVMVSSLNPEILVFVFHQKKTVRVMYKDAITQVTCYHQVFLYKFKKNVSFVKIFIILC